MSLGDTTDQERTLCVRQSLPSFVLTRKMSATQTKVKLSSLKYLEGMEIPKSQAPSDLLPGAACGESQGLSSTSNTEPWGMGQGAHVGARRVTFSSVATLPGSEEVTACLLLCKLG